MIQQAIALIVISVWSTLAIAHGDDKPGPHGGFIQMPGPFHTEVVPLVPDKFKVYLLDINFQNEITDNSSVMLVTHKGPISCQKHADHYFICTLPKGVRVSGPGHLKIKAVRNGQVGNEAVYNLPLKLNPARDASHSN